MRKLILIILVFYSTYSYSQLGIKINFDWRYLRLDSVYNDPYFITGLTFSKMQNISTNTLLGRYTSGTGNIETITPSTGLLLNSGNLSVSSAPILTTSRNINGVAFNGSADILIPWLQRVANMTDRNTPPTVPAALSNTGFAMILSATNATNFPTTVAGVGWYMQRSDITASGGVGTTYFWTESNSNLDYYYMKRISTTTWSAPLKIFHSGSGAIPIANGGTGLSTLGTANQQLRVNSGATALEYFTPQITASASLNFLNTNSGESTELTITVTGAADGDVVALGIPNVASNANSCYTARVSASNTVSIKFNNYSALPIDPTTGTFKVTVFKY